MFSIFRPHEGPEERSALFFLAGDRLFGELVWDAAEILSRLPKSRSRLTELPAQHLVPLDPHLLIVTVQRPGSGSAAAGVAEVDWGPSTPAMRGVSWNTLASSSNIAGLMEFDVPMTIVAGRLILLVLPVL